MDEIEEENSPKISPSYPKWLLRTISLEDIKKYWDKIKISDKCELCGVDDWFFDPTEGEQNIGFPVLGKKMEHPLTAFPFRSDVKVLIAIFVVCKNCGNFRFFAKTRIFEILKEMESQNGNV